MKQFIRDNSLSIVLFGCFFVFLVGLAITGYLQNNQELTAHNQPSVEFINYLASGTFIEAVFENWESEFLQMGALVVLTIFLRQKGSADSKKLRGKEPEDTHAHHSLQHARNWQQRRKAFGDMLYRNSLSLALFGLFIMSFTLHALGGTASYNETAFQHGEPIISTWTYIASSQFWFESFQNWQSEFLAVGALLVLSIFLRQQGSPESKPVAERNSETGDN